MHCKAHIYSPHSDRHTTFASSLEGNRKLVQSVVPCTDSQWGQECPISLPPCFRFINHNLRTAMCIGQDNKWTINERLERDPWSYKQRGWLNSHYFRPPEISWEHSSGASISFTRSREPSWFSHPFSPLRNALSYKKWFSCSHRYGYPFGAVQKVIPLAYQKYTYFYIALDDQSGKSTNSPLLCIFFIFYAYLKLCPVHILNILKMRKCCKRNAPLW